jgi:hypothetical protein
MTKKTEILGLMEILGKTEILGVPRLWTPDTMNLACPLKLNKFRQADFFIALG